MVILGSMGILFLFLFEGEREGISIYVITGMTVVTATS